MSPKHDTLYPTEQNINTIRFAAGLDAATMGDIKSCRFHEAMSYRLTFSPPRVWNGGLNLTGPGPFSVYLETRRV